jgi:hypothetical protein
MYYQVFISPVCFAKLNNITLSSPLPFARHRVIGSLGHRVVGSSGRWVVGSSGRWVIGSLGHGVAGGA